MDGYFRPLRPARLARIVVLGIVVGLTLFAWAPLVLSVALSTDGESVSLFGTEHDKPCAFKARTGITCGTCGLTRAWIFSASGELEAASALHPQGPQTFWAYLWVVSAWSVFLWTLYRGSARARWGAASALAIGLVLVALAFKPSIERNIELNAAHPVDADGAGPFGGAEGEGT